LKAWLRRRALAADIVELQTQLDTFARIYNHERPHQSIGRVTPITRWQATPAAGPAPDPLPHPEWPRKLHPVTVTNSGTVKVGRWSIHLGVEWRGQPAHVQITGTLANVFIANRLVRHLELDPDRNYQPSGRPRGGPRRPRVSS
jgi:hypothetical protein